MKKLLGNVAQTLIITTIALVAVINSSIQNSQKTELEAKTPLSSVTVVTAE